MGSASIAKTIVGFEPIRTTQRGLIIVVLDGSK